MCAYFQGTGMTLNRKTRNALAKLHRNLGHPSYEPLARMRTNDGVGQESIEGAKDLRCMGCEHLKAPESNPQTSHKVPNDFNDQMLFDAFFILGRRR